MQTETLNSLREIGLRLDRYEYPRVYTGGIVKPDDTARVQPLSGEEPSDVKRQRQTRSATGPREGSTGRQGTAGRSGQASASSPVINAGLRATYEAELDDIRGAYPGLRVWHQKEGLWLLTESSVLAGLGKKATFLTALPYSPLDIQKSWAFWTTPISLEWIGPRHTNFGDGSICAFDIHDGTWIPGQSLLNLLDLYTLWALRQEHLATLGKWPGQQSVPLAYERLTEVKDDEHCGCGDSNGKNYRECCKQKDLEFPAFKSFLRFTQGQLNREPPPEIVEFMNNRTTPPPIKNYVQPFWGLLH